MRRRAHGSDRYFDDYGETPIAGSLSWSRRIICRPKETVGLVVILAAFVAVVVNALLLQAGPHPAPIFAKAPSLSAEITSSATPPVQRDRQAEIARSELTAATRAGQASKPNGSVIPVSRQDPIADLIAPANRVVAVQRVLAEFGYGQIKPTGIAGADTKAAIERFERERKLPVTGQISDRLTRELASMKGGPL